MKYLLLILLSFDLFAADYQFKLKQWDELNEQKLLEKYQIIEVDWFDQQCMELVQQLEFSKINQCKLFDSEHFNAYVLNSGRVYFSKGLMKQLKNKHQWASILAHENAHLELNHYLKRLQKLEKPNFFFTKSRLKKFMIKQEDEADLWAADWLRQKGFDENQINHFLIRVNKINDSAKAIDHKKLKKRIKKLKQAEQLDQAFIQLIEAL